MPCGGIWPCAPVRNTGTFTCFYSGCLHLGNSYALCDHWCEEWDAYLHGECIEPFLETNAGRIVLEHGHEVSRRIVGTDRRQILREAGWCVIPDDDDRNSLIPLQTRRKKYTAP